MKRGFTLIELLVTITIIGVLAALITANLSDARARARDAKIKQNLVQLKTALRLYYNDYQTYPATGNGLVFNACGDEGITACTPDGAFSAGAGPTIYMNQLVKSGTYFEFKYYPCNSGESFRAKVTLENPSDPDLAASQARCPTATCVCPGPPAIPCLSYSATDYLVCAD